MTSYGICDVKIHSHATSAFAFFIDLCRSVQLLQNANISVNTITCYHRTHSWCLTQTQTLHVYQALRFVEFVVQLKVPFFVSPGDHKNLSIREWYNIFLLGKLVRDHSSVLKKWHKTKTKAWTEYITRISDLKMGITLVERLKNGSIPFDHFFTSLL